MRERKPVIGITCNFDYRDAVGMVSGMGITGQDWDFVSGDYVYILEKAGAIPVLIPQYGDLEAAKPFLDQLDGVNIAGDSKLENIYGTRDIRVNSFHHQAIKDAGKNVRITAWSEDGVPEAMELEGHPFAVAVQWHPEMMYDSSEQLKLLRAFAEAAGKETET